MDRHGGLDVDSPDHAAAHDAGFMVVEFDGKVVSETFTVTV